MSEQNSNSSGIGSAIAGAVPILGGVAQSVINAVQNRANINRQNRANRELAEYQYSKDLEMWNRGNEYNAPVAQMDRLKKAGLNPNLVYGSGAVAGQSAAQLPKYNAPQQSFNYVPPVDIPGTMGQYQDFQIKQAQLDNLKAQRNSIVQDTLIKTAEANARPDLLHYKKSLARQSESMGIDRQNIMSEKSLQERLRSNYMEQYQGEAMRLKNRLSERQLQVQLEQIANMSARTELTKLEKDMFMTKFWTQTAFNGINSGANLIRSIKGGGPRLNQKFREQQKEIPALKPKLNPDNKAWQKDFESHKEWMRRVNPGAQ